MKDKMMHDPQFISNYSLLLFHFLHLSLSPTQGRLLLKGADLYGQKHERVKEELLNFDPVNYKDMEALGIPEKVCPLVILW